MNIKEQIENIIGNYISQTEINRIKESVIKNDTITNLLTKKTIACKHIAESYFNDYDNLTNYNGIINNNRQLFIDRSRMVILANPIQSLIKRKKSYNCSLPEYYEVLSSPIMKTLKESGGLYINNQIIINPNYFIKIYIPDVIELKQYIAIYKAINIDYITYTFDFDEQFSVTAEDFVDLLDAVPNGKIYTDIYHTIIYIENAEGDIGICMKQ